MDSTSISLLESLRKDGNQKAWSRFVSLYSPLLLEWTRRLGLQESDAADLVQEVLVTLVRKLPEFEYDRSKTFRGWLKTVAMNKWRDLQRKKTPPTTIDPNMLDKVAENESAAIFEEAHYRQSVLKEALNSIQGEFQGGTWDAFRLHGLEGKPAAEVASALGMGIGAVYSAKFRVLYRLRCEVQGLID